MTAFANALRLSGLLGLVVGFFAVTYQFILEDTVVYGGSQPVPEWLGLFQVTLFLGSLAVLFYSEMFDQLFKSWVDVVTGGAIIAQWGLPFSIYLAGVSGLITNFGLMVIICSILHSLVAMSFFLNYLRWVRSRHELYLRRFTQKMRR